MPNLYMSECIPCVYDFYNDSERSTCKSCSPFTHVDKESALYPDGKGAISCLLDDEFRVKETGQIYKANHFFARNLCSNDKYLQLSNICAAEGIIGPISDIQHITKNERDA